MRVSWITEEKRAESVVEYGTESGEYNAKSTGEHTSYRYFLYNSGKIHNVVIGPLKPGTTYFYRCGGSGPEFSLKTPPHNFPLEFVVVGKSLSLGFDTSLLLHRLVCFCLGSTLAYKPLWFYSWVNFQVNVLLKQRKDGVGHQYKDKVSFKD